MKSEKGITLTSLIVYLIVFIFVINLLSLVTRDFYSNVRYITDTAKYVSEFNKFNSYFLEDVKDNTELKSITDNKIVFADGDTYTYENNSIYKNKVRICKNVTAFNFSSQIVTESNDYEKTEEPVEDISENEFTKTIITVRMEVEGSKDFKIENDYVLKYR